MSAKRKPFRRLRKGVRRPPPAKRKRKRKAAPKRKRSSKPKAIKRKPVKAPKRRPVKRKAVKTPKRKPVKRKAPKRKIGKRRKIPTDKRVSDLGDVAVVTSRAKPSKDYRPYPLPSHKKKDLPDSVYAGAMDRLRAMFEPGKAAPAFEHVRAIVEEYEGGEPEDYGRDDAGDFDARDDWADEVEWYPTFDEVYDYIDALVDEYDLDAHDLFEMAFGYSDQEVA